VKVDIPHLIRAGNYITLAFALSLQIMTAYAFEEATHVRMTIRAIDQSKIGASIDLKRQLGIDEAIYSSQSSEAPFGKAYVDVGGSSLKRAVTGPVGKYDQEFFPKVTFFGFVPNDDNYKLYSWLMRGASREDDIPLMPFLAIDDPVNAVRPLNHFFDPVHNLPLTLGGAIGGTQLGRKNPDWALGATDAYTDVNARDDQRRNHFSVFDARETMWRALTLRDKNMSPNISVAGIADGEPLRKAYWATTFRALGDLVHMIQDMGQPQHTRNEPHNGFGTNGVQESISGHKSVFEKYVDARASGAKVFVVTGSGNPVPVNISNLDTSFGQIYPVPRFANYTDYFSTTVASSPSASYAKAGYGLADYSNRRFFTAVKNLGHPDFQLPLNTSSAYSRCKNPDGSDLTSARWDGTPNPNGYKATSLCAATVQDELNASQNASNVALTAESVWDAALASAGLPKTYHMTREVYDDEARLLIPRAIAYSAGIIDYFFRGEMFVAPPAEGVFGLVDHGDPASNCKDTCGFTKIKLRAANSTPDITPPGGTVTPQGMTGGKVVAVAKFRRNSCYTPDLSGEYHGSGGDAEKIAYYNSCVAPQPEEIVVSDAMNVSGIPPCGGNCDAAAVPYTFNFQSPIPINAASLSLQLVYRGALGSEADAVVVQTVDVSEPSYYVYMNASDYIKLGQSVYTPAEINADANLRALVRPTACIVNDQLSPTCFPPVELNFSLLWGDPAPTTTGLTAPVALAAPKQFSRFAMIAPPPGGTAVVNQSASPCLPNELSRFPGRETQERFLPVGTPPVYQPISAVSPMSTARAVYTTYAVACVVNGDGVLQGPDDRFTKMAPLAGAELTPKALAGFSFGN